jgi:general secretion pathway protein I
MMSMASLSGRRRSQSTGGPLVGRTDGFTLLEVLVALSILAIAVTIIFQLFSANLRAIRGSEDYVAAAMRAQIRLREVLLDPKLAETSWSETSLDGYRIDVVVTEMLKERNKDLPVQLLGVALTVYWTKGSKQKATTVKSMKMIVRKV